MKRLQRWIMTAAALCMLVLCLTASGCAKGEEEPAAKEYTLSFVLPEGAGTLPAVRAEEGAPIDVPQPPEYAGHTFLGWYLEADFSGSAQTLPEVMPGEDRTYHALYEEMRYTMTFLSDGETLRTVSGKEGSAIAPPADPVKKGYRFDGWYLEADFSGGVQTLPSLMPGEDRTYYAKFTRVGTLSFVAEGAAAIPDIVAPVGSVIVPPADPVREGAYFVGWFTQPDGGGEAVPQLPSVMPETDRTVYYALFRDYFRLSFDGNGVPVPDGLPPVIADRNGSVTIPEAPSAVGLRFMGWTAERDGRLTFDIAGNLSEGSGYAGGERITLTQDMTLYAQWAVGYRDVAGTQNVVYVCANVTGIGAAVFVRPGMSDKLGFFTDDGSGNAEFSFYFDAAKGGDVVGRLQADGTYRLRDATYGLWMRYDYAAGELLPELLRSDGYGNAGLFTMAGDQIRLTVYGEYAAEGQEYVFTECDPATGEPVNAGETFFFLLQTAQSAGAAGEDEISGRFLRRGNEAQAYFLYENGALGAQLLELDGYGGAHLYASDAQGQPVLTAQGRYAAAPSENAGEWAFTPDSGTAQAFRFILSSVQDGAGYTYFVYLIYDAARAGELSEREGAGKIVTDGYGGMVYTAASGERYEGLFLFEEGASPNTTFYVYDGSSVISQMYFEIDWTGRTFSVGTQEFSVSADGVLTAYTGTSQTVEIPAAVGGIAVTHIAADVFNGKELVSVVLPASVRSIGARAFQNADGTLRRVTFLGSVPPEIDLSAANDPFRWPSASFVIVVPDGAKQAYADAFSAAWKAGGRTGELYRIRSASEADRAPEFEVDEAGVLIAYNRPDGQKGAYDLVLATGYTQSGEARTILAVAAEVFMGDPDLRSIDLGAVTEVGEFAFAYCTGLRTVTADHLRLIGAGAFIGCGQLGRADGALELPAAVSIGMNAFRTCISLRRVTAGAALREIGAGAFAEIKTDADRTDPFCLVLTGGTPPQMASGMSGSQSLNVFLGNSSYRIELPDIACALACYARADWKSYCNSLVLPSGSEQGMYLSGSDVLRLDGRAVFLGTEIWLYAVSGSTITFYVYSSATLSYATFSGTIGGGTVAFTYGGVEYRFRRADGAISYVSSDGAYTLEVLDAHELDPEEWANRPYFDENGDPVYVTDEDGNVTIGADGKPVQATVPPALWLVRVRLNGQAAVMALGGYSSQKNITGFLENGIAYDFVITFRDDTFVYTKRITPRTLFASDGSTLTVSGSSSLILADLALKDFWIVADGVRTRVSGSASYTASSAVAFALDGAFAVQINVRGTAYLIYIGTEGENFFYGAGIAGRTARSFRAADGSIVFVTYDGETAVSAAFVRGTSFFEAELSGRQGSVLTLTEGGRTYTVTLAQDGTCTIV